MGMQWAIFTAEGGALGVVSDRIGAGRFRVHHAGRQYWVWSRSIGLPRVTISPGPMVGTARIIAAVWVRMTRPTTVRLRHWPVDKPDSRTLTPAKDRGPRQTNCACVRSKFGARCSVAWRRYAGDTDFAVMPLDHPLRFQTQVLWQRRVDPLHLSSLSARARTQMTLNTKPQEETIRRWL